MRPTSGAPTPLKSFSSSPYQRGHKVVEAPCHVNAIRHFSERRFRDVEEMKAIAPVPPPVAFGNVRRYRVRRLAKLGAEFESLERREQLNGQLMNLDEQIVGPLPHDE
jgi:hypothetical protein